MNRVGFGVDAHRFGGEPPVVLLGVVVDEARGVDATSDGDLAAHAVADALFGAAALGDLGTHYPSSDPRWRGARSLDLVADAVGRLRDRGLEPVHVDVTVVAQSVRIGPHRDRMRANLAATLGIPIGSVSVKATTTDGLGFTGRDEGLAVFAVATVADA
jgi:2-C-methyl-D-erythritol 2,4-cyclodiphosphate synthase